MYQKSKLLFRTAQNFIPGGVNSPVRAFKSVGGTPIFFKKAKGSILVDVDNNEYLDYVSSWGPMILGHAYPDVMEAVQKQIKNSLSFGAPTELETLLAQLIVEMVPNINKVRMVNSGTEACMSAIRLARGYTGRSKIIKFEGGYHGHADAFLIKAGSGATTFGIPDSSGVTKGTASDTLNAIYNDIDSVEKLIDDNKNEVAAIIIEPVAGNMGCVPPLNNFLHKLRILCDENKVLLIFDEVMTGFRLSKGGAQEYFNINADIVTFGKIIGGGMPVGAYAGRKELMDCVSPLGNVYQAGTLSGNPVAMISGYTTLRTLNEHHTIYENLKSKTANLVDEIKKIFENHKIDFTINSVGSMLSIFFTNKNVVNFTTACTSDKNRFARFYHKMLENGIYLPPSPFESWFISHSLSKEQIAKTINAIEKSVTIL